MAYGSLTVICGPMYAGKTTETLKRILWASNGEGRSVFVYKPSFDTRYGETEIVSHDGLKAKAINISEIPATSFTEGDLVFLDEIQFFMEPYFQGDVVNWVQSLLAHNVEVIAAGLDMDWQGKPFTVTASLLAMANDAKKLTAHCTVCGKPATKTFKKQQDPDSGSVELGATELYEARCNGHWFFPTRT